MAWLIAIAIFYITSVCLMLYELKHTSPWQGPAECFDCTLWKGNPCRDCPVAKRWREQKCLTR